MTRLAFTNAFPKAIMKPYFDAGLIELARGSQLLITPIMLNLFPDFSMIYCICHSHCLQCLNHGLMLLVYVRFQLNSDFSHTFFNGQLTRRNRVIHYMPKNHNDGNYISEALSRTDQDEYQ